jgi:hypothetical protein
MRGSRMISSRMASRGFWSRGDARVTAVPGRGRGLYEGDRERRLTREEKEGEPEVAGAEEEERWGRAGIGRGRVVGRGRVAGGGEEELRIEVAAA